MELLETLQITDILHQVASILLIPTVLVLLILIIYAIWCIGSIIVELIRERRDYRVHVPELVARLESANMEDLDSIIDSSGLLTRQKDDAKELISYLYLSEEARIEVAKRLLASSTAHQQHLVSRTESASRIAPMIGLMGTLIPLGPGIVALGTGDLETLSNSLLIAFDTTVAGLATSVVCYLISRTRRGWYSDYNVSMEAVFNTLLERGEKAHEEGYNFKRMVYVYDRKGKNAVEVPLDEISNDDPGHNTEHNVEYDSEYHAEHNIDAPTNQFAQNQFAQDTQNNTDMQGRETLQTLNSATDETPHITNETSPIDAHEEE